MRRLEIEALSRRLDEAMELMKGLQEKVNKTDNATASPGNENGNGNANGNGTETGRCAEVLLPQEELLDCGDSGSGVNEEDFSRTAEGVQGVFGGNPFGMGANPGVRVGEVEGAVRPQGFGGREGIWALVSFPLKALLYSYGPAHSSNASIK